MDNRILESDNDWDQFVIIDYEHKSKKCKAKNNVRKPIKENSDNKIKIQTEIKKVSSDFSINDAINEYENNSYSYLDLLINNSTYFVRRLLFSICYISIKYMHTI